MNIEDTKEEAWEFEAETCVLIIQCYKRLFLSPFIDFVSCFWHYKMHGNFCRLMQICRYTRIPSDRFIINACRQMYSYANRQMNSNIVRLIPIVFGQLYSKV